ncbi:MAG TPA: DUF4388 domain-containing protein [Ktedonobacteraceae bacterium]
MTKGRDIAAESLGDLLEVARVQQRNGMLRAEYSQGGYLEEGEIYLFAGQPIYARTGRLVGVDALNYLLSWRNIHFTFVVDVPRPPINIFASIRQHSVTTPLGSRTQNLAPSQLPITDGLRWNPQEPQKRAVPPVPQQVSTPGIETLVPCKIGPERDIFSLGLTRRQRLVYFLIDGQRSVGDLARTTNKTLLETEVVINELQEQGLIDL